MRPVLSHDVVRAEKYRTPRQGLEAPTIQASENALEETCQPFLSLFTHGS